MRKPLVIQERLKDDPWKVLVACILLNRTTGRQVLVVIDDLFDAYPTALSMSLADPTDVAKIIETLGMSTRRARYLIDMSRMYFVGDWTSIQDLPGCGAYASDSYEIFVNGRRDIIPQDRVLKLFLEYERTTSEKLRL